MFAFFKKIRKSLIESGSDEKSVLSDSPERSRGRVERYLLYAIGEIALVVIGILLALQINNWNQERDNRIQEKEYLGRLLKDLALDSIDLDDVIERACINLVLVEDALIQLGADTTILTRGPAYEMAQTDVEVRENKIFFKNKHLDHPIFRLESFGHQLTQLTKGRGFDLTETTISDLMSTGKIDVIQDGRLRDEIQSYYAWMRANLGNEESIVYPYSVDFQSILNDMGLPPWNMYNVEQVNKKIGDDHRFEIALYNLYDANHSLIRIIYSNNNSLFGRIEHLRSEVSTALGEL